VETNALWVIAASAALLVLSVSLELHQHLWQLILKPILGNFYRFLLFLILGTLAGYGVYHVLHRSPVLPSWQNAPETSPLPTGDSAQKRSSDRRPNARSSRPRPQQKSEQRSQ
jgi:hypothetical protein